MKVEISKPYAKSLKILSKHDKAAVKKILKFIDMLQTGTYIRRDHALEGKLQKFRSIPIKDNIRLIYYIDTETNTLYLVDLGTHNQVYSQTKEQNMFSSYIFD